MNSVKQDILDHWNTKKIIVHTKLSPEADREISRLLKYYKPEEIKAFIDFYATILEPGVSDREKKYFWSYKWNLWEFLKRGVRKFDGQTPDNYLKNKSLPAPAAVVFKRN